MSKPGDPVIIKHPDGDAAAIREKVNAAIMSLLRGSTDPARDWAEINAGLDALYEQGGSDLVEAINGGL